MVVEGSDSEAEGLVVETELGWVAAQVLAVAAAE